MLLSLQDLSDYLSQLLGSNNDNIRTFVDHIVAFQQGEQVEPTTTTMLAATKPAATPKPTAAPTTTPKKDPPGNQTKSATETAPSTTSSSKPAPVAAKPPPLPTKEDPPQPTKPVVQDEPPKKSVPKKGKAHYVCGCYGTRHKPLANCLVYVCSSTLTKHFGRFQSHARLNFLCFALVFYNRHFTTQLWTHLV